MSLLGIYVIFAVLLGLDLWWIFKAYKRHKAVHKRQAMTAFGGAVIAQVAELITAFGVAHYIDRHEYQTHFDGCPIGNAYTPLIVGLGVASMVLAIAGLIFANKDRLQGVVGAGLLLVLSFGVLSFFAFLLTVSPCFH